MTILSLNKTREFANRLQGFFDGHFYKCPFFSVIGHAIERQQIPGKEESMEKQINPKRYSVIREKNPREIVMLRGSGCKWKRCRFCDYHLDSSSDEQENYELNKKELMKITGVYGKLEIINSGSFCDLNEQTIRKIIEVCKEKEIAEVHFECHWIHRKEVEAFRRRFQKEGIVLKLKIGVETFDHYMRQDILCKGMAEDDPAVIASYFDEACFLFGLPGQTKESMQQDIEIGLAHFERICLNIMVENSTDIKPDPGVIRVFEKELFPVYKDNPRVDILLDNTDFGVGGEQDDE